MAQPKHHILLCGNCWQRQAIDSALVHHYPDFNVNPAMRTRISVIVDSVQDIHDFTFEYKELFDNSYRRIVDLSCQKTTIETHLPQYTGVMKDFVDIEWEFIIGYLSHPILQEKIRRWAIDSLRQLIIVFCYDHKEKNEHIAEKLKRRLPSKVKFETHVYYEESEAIRNAELLEMAKYLHYFYKAAYELKHVPTELPEEEVDKAWNAIEDETLKMSNIYNVMSIPHKMKILGHDRSDWDTFYALTAEEIEQLTAVEHNRWCVERLIQGMRPCTDQERQEIEEDLRKRLSDEEYAKVNPVSLKKKYKNERNAHYDLCAFSELGVDETGMPVTRYDRDLTAAIPLIVKTYNDRHANG